MKRLDSLSEPQRAALLARALPRRTQIPNRLDPFDCTLCLTQIRALVARWRCQCNAPSTGVTRQHISVGREIITIHESHDSYATRLWHCSIVQAGMLASNARAFDGQRVLEVGAGTGLCSLALAATSSAWVIASDQDEAGLSLLRASADEQSLRVQTSQWDICGTSPLPDAAWLVASDVLYTPQLAESLARRCIEMVERGGRAIIADPGRPTRRLFQQQLERQGMLASFQQPSQILACLVKDGPRLLLLHVGGERSVSMFPAHAELDG